MRKRLLFCFIAAAVLISVGLMPQESSAVPSFARQFGKPCSACHTMWPRLTATGREFKLTGYTDVDPDYPRIEQDRLDLLRYAPLSLSVISLPYTKTSGQDDETNIPDEVALFYAGRITPNIGAFIEPVLAPDFNFEFAKIAAYRRVAEGKATIGLVGGKMDAGGVDPYNTIRFTSYHTLNLPAVLDEEHGRDSGDLFQFGSTENVGIIGNAKFFRNMIYAAAGIFRGHESSDPWDFYGRLAFEYPVTYYAFLEGGFVIYDGKERYNAGSGNEYESNVSRFGVDASLQIENGPHIFDIIGLYMKGKDEDIDGPGIDVESDGWYGEITYFYNRTYGATFAYDYMNSDEDHSLNKEGPVFNITYVPWLNTKLALEYSHFDLESENEDNFNVLVHLYF
jgi:hypothetical protein